MPSSSHANCKVCRVRIHARNKFGLCPVHQSQYVTRRARERKRAKLRRSARVQQAAQSLMALMQDVAPRTIEDDVINAVAHPRESQAAPVILEEDHTVSEPTPEPQPSPGKPGPKPRDRVAGMSDERKLAIAGHYANYDIPVESIVRHYGIANGDVSRIADELGIPRRDRRNVGRKISAGHFEGDNWVLDNPEPELPADNVKALENMLRLPPKPEPVAAPSPRPVVPRTNFEARVQGTIVFAAEDMAEALDILKQRWPDLRVTRLEEQP